MINDQIIDLWLDQSIDLGSYRGPVFGFTAVKHINGGFTEQVWNPQEATGEDLLNWFERQPQGDAYFTPRVFSQPARSNETVLASRYLYADLDHDQLDEGEWPPYWHWETSPGSEQAIWLLDTVLPPNAHAAHNKWLTYHLNADKGGWHGSKLLRVPGSLNYKRSVQEMDRFIVPIGHVYTTSGPTALRAFTLGTMETHATGTPDDMPPVPAKDSWNDWVGTVWSDLPLSVRASLEVGVVSDRSRFLWRFYKACQEQEVPIETAFKLALYMPWNKWNTPGQLWEDISKAWTA